MNTAQAYAQALYEAVSAHPRRGGAYLKNLRLSLASRGHEKLLPRIWSEYKKLDLRARRSAAQAQVTPEMARTRTLLELYRKLIVS